MRNILLIAGNAFRETLSMKLVYAVLVLGFGLLALMTIPMVLFDYALEAGDAEQLEWFMFVFVNMLVNGFWLITMVLALLLGSMAVSGEIKRRTIVTILARPVERWQYMLGRWLGIACFLVIVQTISVVLAAALVNHHGIYPSTLIFVAIAETYVSMLLYLTIAMALGAVLSAAPAFAVTVIVLWLLPILAEEIRFITNPSWYAVINAIGHVVPARMPGDLLQESFTMDMVDADYTLYWQVLGENALYGAAFFCVCAVLFTRRQIIAGS